MLAVFQKLEDGQAVVDAQFFVDVVDVDLDRVLGDEKLLGDLPVLPPSHQEGKDFPLPLALIETMRLLDLLGLFRYSRLRSLPRSRGWYTPLTLAGVFLLVSPLVWPNIFFPCIWIGFFPCLNH